LAKFAMQNLPKMATMIVTKFGKKIIALIYIPL